MGEYLENHENRVLTLVRAQVQALNLNQDSWGTLVQAKCFCWGSRPQTSPRGRTCWARAFLKWERASPTCKETGRRPFYGSVVQSKSGVGRLGQMSLAPERGRASTPPPSLLPPGAARTPSLRQAELTQRKPPAGPRTWGYSGEEAMDPESKHLPPLAPPSSHQAAQRPVWAVPPSDMCACSSLPCPPPCTTGCCG